MCDLFTWDSLASFLNSNFTSSLSGALAGALAGALMAQRIAENSKQRDILLQEIRCTNAAIVSAFTICNAALTFKEQVVKDVYETYNKAKGELQDFNRRRMEGRQLPDEIFIFEADFRVLHVPVVPVDVLQNQLYEKISTPIRPLAAIAALTGSLSSLTHMVNRRNLRIDDIRKMSKGEKNNLLALYFGVPYGDGHVDTGYSDAVEAIYQSTDDVIFFSELIMKDLIVYGELLLEKYRRFVKGSKETIHHCDFYKAHEKRLMPGEGNYVDWFTAFENKK